MHSFTKKLGTISTGLRPPLEVWHTENWETGVDVTHHTTEGHTGNDFIQHLQEKNTNNNECWTSLYSPLPCLALTSTWPILIGINKARDEVWGNSDDKGISDDRQDANAFQNAIPDPCNKHTWIQRHNTFKENKKTVVAEKKKPLWMIAPLVYLCLWPVMAEGAATAWQTCRHLNGSQWCCWAELRAEPEGRLPQRWWWSQTVRLKHEHRGVLHLSLLQL